MSTSNPDLIIGASGLLGSHLKLSNVLKPSSKELNILDYTSIILYFKKHKFNRIILLAAYTNVGNSNQEKEKVYLLNVEGVKNIIQIYKSIYKIDPVIIYISTDYVFDGEKGNYKTTDFINPVSNNYYAMTKALAESLISYNYNSTIIRTSFCRNNIWPHEYAFHDQYTSRDRIDIIAPMIENVINKNISGIYHVGTERKSVFDLALSIDPKIKPISRLSVSTVNIPYDTSLDLQCL